MSDTTNPDTPNPEPVVNDPDSPGGVSQEFADAQQQGYIGVRSDPTPLHNYTSQGQAEGAPTPETDKTLAQDAGQGGPALDSRFGDDALSRGPSDA